MDDSGITCGRCGSGNAAGAVTCRACGAVLAAYASPSGSETADGSPPASFAPAPPGPPAPGPAVVTASQAAAPDATTGTAEPSEAAPDRDGVAPLASDAPGPPSGHEPPQPPSGADATPTVAPIAFPDATTGGEIMPTSVDDATSAPHPSIADVSAQTSAPAAAVTVGPIGHEAIRPVRADPDAIDEAGDVGTPPITSTVGGRAGTGQPPTAVWGPVVTPPDERPGDRPRPLHTWSWSGRFTLPTGTSFRPEVIGVGLILGLCVLFSLLRALPLGSWSFFVIIVIAAIAINAARKRR